MFFTLDTRVSWGIFVQMLLLLGKEHTRVLYSFVFVSFWGISPKKNVFLYRRKTCEQVTLFDLKIDDMAISSGLDAVYSRLVSFAKDNSLNLHMLQLSRTILGFPNSWSFPSALLARSSPWFVCFTNAVCFCIGFDDDDDTHKHKQLILSFFICFQIYPGGGSRARTLPPWRISWRIGIPKFWPTTQTMNMWTISKLFFLAWKLRTNFSKLCTGQICGCLLLIEIFWSNHWQRCFPRSKLVQSIASASWTSPGGNFNLNFIC